MNTKIVTRVEKHVIKQSHPYFPMLRGFCHASKNLYNHANFLVRQEFDSSKKWLKYRDLDKILKNDLEYPDYREMPTAQSAQQTLRLLDKNWKSFFKAIKDWSKHKEKYLGMPKMPKYLKKNGFYPLILTNQNCKLVDEKIQFPKSFGGFSIKTKCASRPDFCKFQQVRFIPHSNRIVAEVIYTIQISQTTESNGRCISIDIGVNNLATVANNLGEQAFIINGRPLKSINQYFNKKAAHYKSVTKMMNCHYNSKRIDKITTKRTAKMDDYMHKASRFIIEYCLNHDVSTIIIGKNDEWKQRSKMAPLQNQTFIQIPFARFIEMIQYKAEEQGIAVILTEESYTSGTSFIDDEDPTKENYNKSRRIKRGMFVSNSGMQINADLNGAYQIMKKVVPIKWDRGCTSHPVVVGIR